MKNYRVVVEEVYRGWVWVEAESEEEAQSKVVNMTRCGDLNPPEDFDGETFVDVVDEEEINNVSSL